MKKQIGYVIEKIKIFLRFKKKYRYAFAIVIFVVTGDFLMWYDATIFEGNRVLAHDWSGLKSDFTFFAWCLGAFAVGTLLIKGMKKIFPFIEKLDNFLKV